MNNCSKYIEQMNMYLDGELKGSKISELLEHIDRCPNCKKRFESLKIISFQSREMEINVPADLHEKIMRNVRTNARPAKKKIGVQRFMPYVAAAAVFFILVASTFGGNFTDYFKFGEGSETTGISAPAGNTKAASFMAKSSEPAANGGADAQKMAVTEAANGVSDTSETFDHADEEFAFLKLFSGKGELPEFVTEHKYIQDPDSRLYYVYIENDDEKYNEFEKMLTASGFTDGGELKNAAIINETAPNVLYIINIK